MLGPKNLVPFPFSAWKEGPYPRSLKNWGIITPVIMHPWKSDNRTDSKRVIWGTQVQPRPVWGPQETRLGLKNTLGPRNTSPWVSWRQDKWILWKARAIDHECPPVHRLFHTQEKVPLVHISFWKWRGFPDGPVVKNQPCNARDTGWDTVWSLVWEAPNAEEQLSLCTTTTEPAL